MVFTARKRNSGEGNVFTPVCHSVHRGELHPGGVCIWGGGSASRGVGVCIQGEGVCIQEGGDLHPGGLGRPPSDTTGYGQRAGGTHPTGMHFCLLAIVIFNCNCHISLLCLGSLIFLLFNFLS